MSRRVESGGAGGEGRGRAQSREARHDEGPGARAEEGGGRSAGRRGMIDG